MVESLGGPLAEEACREALQLLRAGHPALALEVKDGLLVDCRPIQELGQRVAAGSDLWAAFADTGLSQDGPGWPLRNLLYRVACLGSAPPVLRVLCLRAGPRGAVDPSRCTALEVSLGSAARELRPIGWLTNDKGRMAPRVTDLGPSMSPHALAEQAADLNLRLMRWREAPELDLGRIRALRCLLLGAGTLGCVAARTLLGWGVRDITLVDSGKASSVREPVHGAVGA